MIIKNVKIEDLQIGDKIIANNDIIVTGIGEFTKRHYINNVHIGTSLGDIFGKTLKIERQSEEELTEIEISEKVAKIKDLQEEVEVLHQKLSNLKAARRGVLTAEEIADGWIAYDGKGCPVNENDNVFIRFGDGFINPDAWVAKDVGWNNNRRGDDNKIIAYKITDNKR